MEIRSDRNRILVDLGLPLTAVGNNDSGDGELENLSGEALLKKGWLPDIEGIYAWNKRLSSIDAVVLSHPHLDHYGFTPYLKEQVPIFLGP